MEQRDTEQPLVGEFGGTYHPDPQESSTTLTNVSALSHEEPGSEELNPTQDEMERERLMAQAEQLQEDIEKLRGELRSKEAEMAEVKRALGITPYVEFKQSITHGWEVLGNKLKGLQDSEGYRKVDEKLTGWKSRVEESTAYQKTVTTLSDGSKKAGDAISSAGTKIKENEKVKAIGEKTSSAIKRTGTAIKEKSSMLKEKIRPTVDQGEGETPVPDVTTDSQNHHSSELSHSQEN